MSKFLSSRFFGIEPYTPGEQPKTDNLIKLNTNESPFPPSPRVIGAINANEVSSLNLYSDPETKDLISAVSKTLGTDENRVIMGNGSDEILAFFFLAFCDKENNPVFPDITYGFYPVFCKLFGLKPDIIPLKDDFTIDPEDYFNKNKPIVIANPNAPTGLSLNLNQIEEILNHNDSIVMIDEAYVDFGAESALPLLKNHDNLIISRTFSKSRSLAGARLGFAVSSPCIINDMNKMKFSFNPYNINRLTCLAGRESILDAGYFNECVKKITDTREYLTKELMKREFFVLNSKTNFIFASPPKITGLEYYKKLREKNILVRHFNKERINDFVRITIGSKRQIDALLDATDEILSEI